MSVLGHLKPIKVWEIFEEITKIPRCSKNEEQIRAWTKNWADSHNLTWKEDKVGNLLITKKGTTNSPTLVLQAHLDMVCQKTNDSQHDFTKDPIPILIEDNNEWVTANKTSLGSDNGVGMALALALLLDNDSKPIEVFLTVDEETGLTGAFNVQKGFFTGEYLLNLDSEDMGEITVSSAGGGGSKITFDLVKEKLPTNANLAKITISKLKGGHSGVDIDKPRINAIKLLTHCLINLQKNLSELYIVSMDGGTVGNAIPRDASAVVAIPKEDEKLFNKLLLEFKVNAVSNEEPDLDIQFSIIDELVDNVLGGKFSKKLLDLLDKIPHGPQGWSKDIKGLVETSNNLAIVKINNNEGYIACSTRSSVNTELEKVRNNLKSLAEDFGVDIEQSPSYPGWEYEKGSPFLKLAEEIYKDVYGKVKLTAIHAGLECGLFKTVNPNLQIVSLGPQVENAHSPDERVRIKDVELIYDIVQKILERMKEFE